MFLPQLTVLLVMNMYIQAVISSFHSVPTFVFLAFRLGLILLCEIKTSYPSIRVAILVVSVIFS